MADKQPTKKELLAQMEAAEKSFKQSLKPIHKKQAVLRAQETRLTTKHNQLIRTLEKQIEAIDNPPGETGDVAVFLDLHTSGVEIVIYRSQSAPISLKRYCRVPYPGCEKYTWTLCGYNVIKDTWNLYTYGREHTGKILGYGTDANIYVSDQCNLAETKDRELLFFLPKAEGEKLVQLLNTIIVVGDTSPLDFKAILPIIKQGYGLDVAHFKLTAADWQYIVKFLGYQRLITRTMNDWAEYTWRLTPTVEAMFKPNKKGDN